MRFGNMDSTRVRALHETTVDVQREVAEQHGSSTIWLHVDQMWSIVKVFHQMCETISVVTLIDPLKIGGQGNDSPCYEKK
jgi:hypothetical protein